MTSWYFKPHHGSLIDAMKDTVGALSFDGVLDKIIEYLKPIDDVSRKNISVSGEKMSDDRCGIRSMFRVMWTYKEDNSDKTIKSCVGHIFCEDDYDIEKWNLYMKECENVGR